jgi:sec-independent protein translocase protein TatB
LVIGLVLLIVVGPEQLPGLVRRVGHLVSQVRDVTDGLRTEFMAGIEEIEQAADVRSWAEDDASENNSSNGAAKNPPSWNAGSTDRTLDKAAPLAYPEAESDDDEPGVPTLDDAEGETAADFSDSSTSSSSSSSTTSTADVVDAATGSGDGGSDAAYEGDEAHQAAESPPVHRPAGPADWGTAAVPQHKIVPEAAAEAADAADPADSASNGVAGATGGESA